MCMPLPSHLLSCHGPVNDCTCPAPGSLAANALCGVYPRNSYTVEGTYTAEGINKLAEAIKASTTLTSLECAASPHDHNCLAPYEHFHFACTRAAALLATSSATREARHSQKPSQNHH